MDSTNGPSGGPKQPAPGYADDLAELTVYGIRRCVGAIPWGDGPGHLPYQLTDMGGGPDAVAPSEMIALAPGRFWLRDPVSGRVYLAELPKGTTREVNLTASVAGPLAGVDVIAFGLASTPGGEVAALVGGKRGDSDKFGYAMCVFTALGSPRGCVPLPSLSEVPDVPRRLAVATSGIVWVIYGAGAWVFEAGGNELNTVDAPGVLTSDSFYCAAGIPPKLYNYQGDACGEIEIARTLEPIRFAAAGPNGILLGSCEIAPIPDRLDEKLDAFDVLQFVPSKQKLELHDRVLWPELSLDVQTGPPDADGSPARSYFPPESACFAPNGDLYMLEHTSAECRFCVSRRLNGLGDGWKDKFSELSDLSPAEIEVYSSECLARLGLWEEAGALAAFFKPTVWASQAYCPTEQRNARMQDPILRRIGQARPSAGR